MDDMTEEVISQDEHGAWGRRRISVAQRFRLRVVSDASQGKSHKFGHGEEFDILVDRRLGFWVRPFGGEGPYRRDEDAYGVAVVIDDDGSLGMRDQWTDEAAETYDHGSTRHHSIRVAKRCGLRVVSDRLRARPGDVCHTVDFQLVVDTHLGLWLAASGELGSTVFCSSTERDGVYVAVIENITAGVDHSVSVQTKQSDPDDLLSRWVCVCGAGSRAPMTKELAEEEAGLHIDSMREREDRERASRVPGKRPGAAVVTSPAELEAGSGRGRSSS